MNIQTEKDALNLYNKGKKTIENGIFFNGDYLKGGTFFIQAGEIFKKLNIYDKSNNCYNEAINCFKKLNDKLKINDCYIRKTENYFLLKRNDKAISCLNLVINNYINENNYENAIKIYIKLANECIKNNNIEAAEYLLLICLTDCQTYPDNNIYVNIYGEICLSKYLNILCLNKKYKEAINIIKEIINANLKYEKEDFYSICQMYIKLAFVKILNNEEFEVEDIIKEMSKLKYENINDDIKDLRSLIDSLNNLNKIQFDYYIYGVYLLFEENLLSNLKELFNEKKVKIENK